MILLQPNQQFIVRRRGITYKHNMKLKNIQYYVYDEQPNTSEVITVEEKTILKQLQEAVSYSKENYGKDELSAAIGMMLMHYQVVTEPEFAPDTIGAAEVDQNDALKLTKNNSKPVLSLHTLIQHIRQYIFPAVHNYTISDLLVSCLNIVKELLFQNGL